MTRTEVLRPRAHDPPSSPVPGMEPGTKAVNELTEVLATTGMSAIPGTVPQRWLRPLGGLAGRRQTCFPRQEPCTEAKLTELGNLSEGSTDVKADPTAVIPQPITQSSWRGDSLCVSMLAASGGICLQPPQPELLLIPQQGIGLGYNSSAVISPSNLFPLLVPSPLTHKETGTHSLASAMFTSDLPQAVRAPATVTS